MSRSFLARRHQAAQASEMDAANVTGPVEGLINLTIGDPDMVTDRRIIEDVYQDLLSGHTHYTDSRGDPELREAIRAFYQKQYGMTLADGQVFVCTAGNIAMYLAMQVLLDPGDEVLIPTPCFGPYLEQVELAGGVPVAVPTYEERGFRVTADDLEAALTERTKVLLFNTPCNPTGVCYGKDDLKVLADFAKKHDLCVVADDIYTDITFDIPFVPIASLPGMAERTVSINSFSKNYTMAGWRIGCIVAPEEIVTALDYFNCNVVFAAPSPSQRGALAALRHRDEIVPATVAEYKKRLEYAAMRINAMPGLRVLPPQGTFYLFPCVKPSGLTTAEAVAKLAEAGVLVVPGTAYGGAAGEGYFRISCTVPVEELKVAFDRIEAIPEFGGKKA